MRRVRIGGLQRGQRVGVRAAGLGGGQTGRLVLARRPQRSARRAPIHPRRPARLPSAVGPRRRGVEPTAHRVHPGRQLELDLIAPGPTRVVARVRRYDAGRTRAKGASVSLGPAEILLLAVVALVFVGPRRLPKRPGTSDQRGGTLRRDLADVMVADATNPVATAPQLSSREAAIRGGSGPPVGADGTPEGSA